MKCAKIRAQDDKLNGGQEERKKGHDGVRTDTAPHLNRDLKKAI